MNLAHLLANASRSFPEQPAISVGDHRLYTYAAYGELAARLASSMTGRLGLQAGDRVALAMTNNAEYLATLFAIWRAGLVAVPANARLHAPAITMKSNAPSGPVWIRTPNANETIRIGIVSVAAMATSATMWPSRIDTRRTGVISIRSK